MIIDINYGPVKLFFNFLPGHCGIPRFMLISKIVDQTKVLKKEANMEKEYRPWGYYEILADETDHKAKRIVVYPGKRLSLQRHTRRAEHWFVIYGAGVVTLNDNTIGVAAGQAVDIACGAWHRIQNSGEEDLAFIEVQTGSYFGEDDIERMADDYGRV